MSGNQPVIGPIDETRVRRFEAAWLAGAPEPMADCLPSADDPSCLPTLEELVHIELEFAWTRWADTQRLGKEDSGQPADEPPLLERYLEDFPALDNSQQLTRLLQQEYFHRLDCGIQSPLSEYCRRFPALIGNKEEAAILLQQENSLVDEASVTPVGTMAPHDSADQARAEKDGQTLASRPVSLAEANVGDEVREVAGYRVIGELGRGGMGVVYKALDPKLNRIVALKMVLAGDHAGPKERERFQREARAIAQLQHPHIVQIFDVGEENDLPFFVLEFIRGGSLDRQIDGRPRNARQAADLVETLALTMHVAHEQGIIHRDLKPANVLMAPRRVPKITDFGLAKQLADSRTNTATGAVIGTPSYMAPEQAAGETDRVGPAADIHALGAILYTLITGRPPFQGETSYDTIIQVIEQEPLRPTILQPKIPRDVETICLKCLQKDTQRRYATAQELADDLRRFLERRPIVARPIGWLERGIKWARRKPSVAALLGLLVLSPLVGWGFVVNQQRSLSLEDQIQGLNEHTEEQEKISFSQSKELVKENKTARAAIVVAQRNKKKAEDNLKVADELVVKLFAEHERLADARYKADMGLAASDWDQHNLKRLNQRLQRYNSPDGKVDRRQFEWYFWRRRSRQNQQTFTGHALPVVSLACSPDGTWIASGSLDKTVRLWDTTTGKIIRTLEGHARPVSHVIVSPDGGTLLSSGLDGTARFWNVDDGKQMALIEDVDPEGGVAFFPDGKAVAIAHNDTSIRFWSPIGQPLPRPIRPLLNEQPSRSLGPLAISDNGRYLAASCSFDGPTVLVFDLAARKQLHSKEVNWPRIFDLAFSPDGKQLAITGRGVRLWNVASGATRAYKPHGRWAVRSVLFSGSGQPLITAGNDLAIHIWDVNAPDRARIRLGHHRPVISLALHPDGNQLFSGSEDGTIKSWVVTAGRDRIDLPEQWESEQTIKSVSRMTMGLDSGLLFVGTDDGKLLIVNPVTGRVEQVQEIGDGQVMALASVPHAGHLVVGFRTGQVVVWDPTRKRSIHTLDAHKGIAYAVAVSSDGQRLATGGQDQEIHLWDLDSGTLIRDLPWRGKQVRGLAFHPRTGQLAAVGRFGIPETESVVLWDEDDGAMSRTFDAKGAFRFHCVAISANGKWLAAGDSRGDIWIWNVVTGKNQPTCSGHIAGVRSLQFSADGRRLTSSGGDGTVRLWDPIDGTELLTLRDEGGVPDVFFSGDGNQLLSLSSAPRMIRFWNARPLDRSDDRSAEESVPAKDTGQ